MDLNYTLKSILELPAAYGLKPGYKVNFIQPVLIGPRTQIAIKINQEENSILVDTFYQHYTNLK